MLIIYDAEGWRDPAADTSSSRHHHKFAKVSALVLYYAKPLCKCKVKSRESHCIEDFGVENLLPEKALAASECSSRFNSVLA
jgi:hypothetical protein